MRPRSKLAIAAFGLAACTLAFAEPLEEFDALAARCVEAFSQRPLAEVVYAEAAGSWVKRIYAPATVVYSARKTLSEVSPYVAQIEVTEAAAARRGGDEESARAMEVSMDENAVRSLRRINYAYQENTWVAIGGTSVIQVRRDANDEFRVAESANLSLDALMHLKGPLATCASGVR